jgi:hypothetical protein
MAQPPQFFASLLVSTHVPKQRVDVGNEHVHVPLLQNSVDAHA